MNHFNLIVTILFGLILGANAFSYKDAEDWGKKYPKCKGQHQSPIRYKYSVNNSPSIIERIRFTDSHKSPKRMTMKNTGHTVELKAEWNGKPPSCTGGPLHGNYVFEKVTFHWSQNEWAEDFPSSDPNEDSMSLYLMDLEMHMFFYRTDLESFEKAEREKKGLAVFKSKFQAGFNYATYMLDDVEKNLHKVQFPNSTAEINPFPLSNDFDYGYSTPLLFYDGSLDYPPCSESVTWFIDESGIPVPESLVREFKKIKLAGGDVSNVRPVQPLNKRQVKFVYTDEKH